MCTYLYGHVIDPTLTDLFPDDDIIIIIIQNNYIISVTRIAYIIYAYKHAVVYIHTVIMLYTYT